MAESKEKLYTETLLSELESIIKGIVKDKPEKTLEELSDFYHTLDEQKAKNIAVSEGRYISKIYLDVTEPLFADNTLNDKELEKTINEKKDLIKSILVQYMEKQIELFHKNNPAVIEEIKKFNNEKNYHEVLLTHLSYFHSQEYIEKLKNFIDGKAVKRDGRLETLGDFLNFIGDTNQYGVSRLQHIQQKVHSNVELNLPREKVISELSKKANTHGLDLTPKMLSLRNIDMFLKYHMLHQQPEYVKKKPEEYYFKKN